MQFIVSENVQIEFQLQADKMKYKCNFLDLLLRGERIFFFIGQVLDLPPNTGNHTQPITCTIRLEIALS